MKKIEHKIKLEKSVKIMLGVLALGVMLNAFSSPIVNELYGIKDALASWNSNGPGYPFYISCTGCN